jgi:hypothetical protein
MSALLEASNWDSGLFLQATNLPGPDANHSAYGDGL